jgi:hypothetical protein
VFIDKSYNSLCGNRQLTCVRTSGTTELARGNGTIRDSASLVVALLVAGTSEIEGLVCGNTPIAILILIVGPIIFVVLL